LFLTSDGRLDVVIAFVIDEPVTSIPVGEAFECACFVLAHSRLKVAGYADVEHAGEARHDVHGVETLAHFDGTLYGMVEELYRQQLSMKHRGRSFGQKRTSG